jgi:hypothetical protein
MGIRCSAGVVSQPSRDDREDEAVGVNHQECKHWLLEVIRGLYRRGNLGHRLLYSEPVLIPISSLLFARVFKDIRLEEASPQAIVFARF